MLMLLLTRCSCGVLHLVFRDAEDTSSSETGPVPPSSHDRASRGQRSRLNHSLQVMDTVLRQRPKGSGDTEASLFLDLLLQLRTEKEAKKAAIVELSSLELDRSSREWSGPQRDSGGVGGCSGSSVETSCSWRTQRVQEHK